MWIGSLWVLQTLLFWVKRVTSGREFVWRNLFLKWETYNILRRFSQVLFRLLVFASFLSKDMFCQFQAKCQKQSEAQEIHSSLRYEDAKKTRGGMEFSCLLTGITRASYEYFTKHMVLIWPCLPIHLIHFASSHHTKVLITGDWGMWCVAENNFPKISTVSKLLKSVWKRLQNNIWRFHRVLKRKRFGTMVNCPKNGFCVKIRIKNGPEVTKNLNI